MSACGSHTFPCPCQSLLCILSKTFQVASSLLASWCIRTKMALAYITIVSLNPGYNKSTITNTYRNATNNIIYIKLDAAIRDNQHIQGVPLKICIISGELYLGNSEPKMLPWHILFGQPFSAFQDFTVARHGDSDDMKD